MKYYRYTRGDKYVLICSVDEHGFVDYVEEATPEDVDREVLLRFYDDAEKAVMQLHLKEENK